MSVICKSRMALATVLCSIVSAAPAIVIEGFENSTDPGGWQAVSPPGQTSNAENHGNVPIYSALHVTEGTQSGDFTTTWTIPGTSNSNPHVSGGPGVHWSIRYNLSAPNNLNGNAISTSDGVITVDVFNANPYPLSMSIMCDTAASTQLERGPFIEFAANSGGTYTWNLADTPPVGWITGNSSFDGSATARIKGMLLYTELEPTSNSCDFFVDNIQNLTAQEDVEAPAVPMPYAAIQGPNPGEVILSWRPNTEPDLAGYRIYMATDNEFNNPTTNRLTYPLTSIAETAAGANSITLTGLPTDTNVYLQVRAFDNATPISNQSEGGISLGVRLRGDGGAVDDHVILDLDRNVPGTAAFALEGYAHAIVYNAQALNLAGRYFDSATARAVDEAAHPLVPNATGITIWSNLLDGTGGATEALSDASVVALTAFSAAEGNLLISGTGLAEDLTTRGVVQQTFLSEVLKAELLNPNIGVAEITGTEPLQNMGVVVTNANNFVNVSSYPTTSNEQLAPLAGATATGQYTGSATPDAGVVHGNKVVMLGYAFESVAGPDTFSSENARFILMQDAINYLLDTSGVSHWMLY